MPGSSKRIGIFIFLRLLCTVLYVGALIDMKVYPSYIIQTGHSKHPMWRSVVRSLETSSTRLECSHAQKTNESIEPTMYREDLYNVLEISTNATIEEIKKSYLKIVAKNHPDRNSSQEALMIFRNATQAYTTLRNPKLRSKYDTKIRAREAMRTLETVGTEVFETARPIVGNAARAVYEEIVSPLSTSAWELSSAAIEASRIVSKTKSANENFVDLDEIRDRWKIAESAFSSARLRKRKELTKERILRTDSLIHKTEKRISISIEALRRLNATISQLAVEDRKKRVEVEASESYYNGELARLSELQARLNASLGLFGEKEMNVYAINDSLANITFEKENCIRKIQDMERQITQLKSSKASFEVSESQLKSELQLQTGIMNKLMKQVQSQQKEVDQLRKVVATSLDALERKRSTLLSTRVTQKRQTQEQEELLNTERSQKKLLGQTLRKKMVLEAVLRAVEQQEKEGDGL